MNINFYLNRDKKSIKKEKRIYAYLSHLKNRIAIPINYFIEPKNWDVKKQKANSRYKNSLYLNSYLENFKNDLNQIYLQNVKPTTSIEDVRNLFRDYILNRNIQSFYTVYETFIQTNTGILRKATLNKYRTVLQHIKNFEKETKYAISFDSINMEFYNKFKTYMYKIKLTDNTINKYFIVLKSFLNQAVINKNSNNLEFKNFKSLKSNITDIIYLTVEELYTIYQFDLSNNLALERVRDVFCFSCFTGARFSDLPILNFNSDVKGGNWHLNTQKTSDKLVIPLNEYAMEIVNKYKLDNKLPVISNQKTNRHLKELCKIIGLNEITPIVRYNGSLKIRLELPKYELVTTHTARRTFVTLSLEKGMRRETLMSITGHKDYRTLQKYINITNSVKQDEMLQVWSKKEDVTLGS